MKPTDTLVSAEDIEALGNADPRFSAWARRCYLTGDLATVVQALIQAGKADEARGALEYLADFAAGQSLGRHKVGRADFGQRAPHHRLRELTRLLEKSYPASSNDVFRMHGLIGHAAVPRLLAGELVTKTRGARRERQSRQRGFAWHASGEETLPVEHFPRKLPPQQSITLL